MNKSQEEHGKTSSTLSRIAFYSIIFICLFIFASSNTYAWHPITKREMSKSAKSFAGIYPEYPKIDYGTGDQAKLIKRGEYIARTGDCIACHTNASNGGDAFAGGLPIKTPFGTFYSPNITPDKQYGIGKWTDDDFINAMHNGKSPSGANYFPVFPYLYFSKLSQQDLRSLFAYLRAVPASATKNKQHDVPFPFNVRFAQYGWKILFFYRHDDMFKHDPKHSPEWNRGAYLVEGAGHCGMCHTPLNTLGAPKWQYYLTGAFVNGYWCPNITGEGLKDSSHESIANVFKSDELLNDAGIVAGGMAEVNHNSLQHLTDADLLAIATYLKSVKSEQPLGVKASYKKPTLVRGREVYYKACYTCHQEGLAGAPVLGDGANFVERLRARHLNGLYRHAINGYNSMPIKGGCVTCSENDIEAAVDFILDESLSRAQKQELANPQPRPKPTIAEGKQIYQSHCAVCHDKGALGAPVLGDKQVWEPLIAKNMDTLIHNTLVGSHKMPRKGGCKYCSTSEVIAAVKYMVQESKVDGDYSLW